MDNAAVSLNKVLRFRLTLSKEGRGLAVVSPCENGRSLAARYQWEG